MRTLADIRFAQDAGEIGDLGRRVLTLCSAKGSPGYWNMAQTLNVYHHDVARVGADLRNRGFAKVGPTRLGGRFTGSVIYLTDLGVQLREFVATRDWT